MYPPTRHTNGYLSETSVLPLPGTYTTTISGQCSARGHCLPAAHLRRQQCKKIPLVYFVNTQEVRIYLSKKFSPKGAKYSTALFYYLFFLNRCTLKHKTPASKQPEFLFIAVFIFVNVPAFSAARTSVALRKPPRKTSLYPGSANMRQDHAPLQNPGNSPRADKPPNRKKNRNRRLL